VFLRLIFMWSILFKLPLTYSKDSSNRENIFNSYPQLIKIYSKVPIKLTKVRNGYGQNVEILAPDYSKAQTVKKSFSFVKINEDKIPMKLKSLIIQNFIEDASKINIKLLKKPNYMPEPGRSKYIKNHLLKVDKSEKGFYLKETYKITNRSNTFYIANSYFNNENGKSNFCIASIFQFKNTEFVKRFFHSGRIAGDNMACNRIQSVADTNGDKLVDFIISESYIEAGAIWLVLSQSPSGKFIEKYYRAGGDH
jgi:hypothetical protein